MAKAKSSLLASLGSVALEAHEEFKDAAVVFSAGGDPPPIDAGVAKLTEIRFSVIEDDDSENKGKLQFYAAGVIVAPKAVEVNGSMIPTEGLRTRIIEPLFDTPTRTRKTVKEHLGKVYNELKKLGLDTSSMTLQQIEEALPAMAEAGIYFRFRIWKGKKQTTGQYAGQEPIANHEWNGIVDWEEQTSDDVQEAEEAPAVKAPAVKAPTAKAPAAKAPTPAAPPKAAAPAVKEAPTPAPATAKAPAKGKAAKAPPEVDVTKLSLAELVEKASNENHVPSQIEITARAKELGIDAESDEYENWQAVVDAMEAAANSSAEDSTEEIDWDAQGEAADQGDTDAVNLINQTAIDMGLNPDEDSAWSETAAKIKASLSEASAEVTEWVPSVGESYLYKAPKTKSAVPCEVVAVFEGKKTVNLKSDKATYKNVSWDELQGAE